MRITNFHTFYNEELAMPDKVSEISLNQSDYEVNYQSSHVYRDYGKRVLDIAISLVLLPFILPLVALLALFVARDGASPIYAHERVGRGGRRFRCYKLRSMVANSAEVLEDLLATDQDARKEWEQDRKLSEDPRVTRLGNFMRRTSLDELPQFFNVLRGDMSLVGPRPVTAAELPRYGRNLHHYLSLRPGLSGEWQVSGRNEVSYAQRVQMDANYERNLNFGRDFRIIAMTAMVLVRKTGK
ncbi:MAG: sugar transferase [Paracoccus denitrificans]|uniref:Sugar transferase n=1 Tax=Paracoccus denitrificans TaxID=266 RepID=A0A533IDW9_PARDE|nr:MAG: sugar transferase [Paracoccus denitrificans]